MLQWREKAVEPKGDQRSELWFFYHLGRMAQGAPEGLHRRARPAAAGPQLGLRGRTATSRARDVGAASHQRLRPHDGQVLNGYMELKNDGSTSCGCWIYSGVYADGVNQAARRKPRSEQDATRAWSGAGPGRTTVACSTTAPPPTRRAGRGASARSTSGGTRTQGRVDRPGRAGLREDQAAVVRAPEPAPSVRPRCAETTRSSCRRTARPGCTCPNGLQDGPMPTHYEPHESPFRNPLYGQQGEPDAQGLRARGQPVQPVAAGGARPRSSRSC